MTVLKGAIYVKVIHSPSGHIVFHTWWFLTPPQQMWHSTLWKLQPWKKHLLLEQTGCDWKPIIVPVTEGNGKFPPLSLFLTLWNVKGQTGPLCVETISGWGSDKLSRHHDTLSMERQQRSLMADLPVSAGLLDLTGDVQCWGDTMWSCLLHETIRKQQLSQTREPLTYFRQLLLEPQKALFHFWRFGIVGQVISKRQCLMTGEWHSKKHFLLILRMQTLFSSINIYHPDLVCTCLCSTRMKHLVPYEKKHSHI